MEQLYIIIAEDDSDDRFLLQTAFDENGFKDTLHFIENGYELLEHLKIVKNCESVEKIPDFILLDLNMPKKDGREVLQEMKDDFFLKQIPVVVFSTTSNELEKKRCIEMGAASYFTKPVTFEALIKVIALIRNSQVIR